MKVTKNKIFISAILVINLALAVTIFILAKEYKASKKEFVRVDSLNKDSLQYFKKLSRANYLLLQAENEEAIRLYALLDSTGNYTHTWRPLVSEFLENQHNIKDTTSVLKSRLNSLDLLMSNLQPVAQALQEDVDRKNEMLDSLTYDVWGKEMAIKLLAEKNQSLQTKVDELKSTYQRLTFEAAGGKSIRYFGETVNGKAQGFGIGIYASKGSYEGEWKDNMRHGKGKYIWANGDFYEGEFENDLRKGYGIYNFTTGEKYEGQWKNDVREGSGTFYSKEGKVLLTGNWKNDKFVKTEGDSANIGL